MKARLDILLYGGLFCLFFLLAAYYNYWADPSPFGFEYGNIAASLASGNGFSDPFGVESGPTAWMPPFYVYLLSSIFLVFGIKSQVSMWVVLLIQALALTFTCYMLLKLAEQTPYYRCRHLVILTFLLPLLMSQQEFFMGLHDMWVLIFSSVFIIYTIVQFIRSQDELSIFQLSVIAIFLPLISPSMALGFAVAIAGNALITAVRIARTPDEDISFASFNTSAVLRYSVLTGFVFLMSAGTWTFRNYAEFGKFIPVKSNLWYDFYQANYVDADGVVSSSTFMKSHPLGNPEILDDYVKKGEIEFITDYEHQAKQMLRNSKLLYFEKLFNRFKNALLFTRTESDIQPAQIEQMSRGDLNLLVENRFIHKSRWINLELSGTEIKTLLSQMDLEHPEEIYELWLLSKAALSASRNSFFNQIRGYTVSLLPVICILAVLLFSRSRSHPIFIITIVVYFVHLLPYIIVSHYMRYQLPLAAFQALFTFFFVGMMFNRFCGSEEYEPESAS